MHRKMPVPLPTREWVVLLSNMPLCARHSFCEVVPVAIISVNSQKKTYEV